MVIFSIHSYNSPVYDCMFSLFFFIHYSLFFLFLFPLHFFPHLSPNSSSFSFFFFQLSCYKISVQSSKTMWDITTVPYELIFIRIFPENVCKFVFNYLYWVSFCIINVFFFNSLLLFSFSIICSYFFIYFLSFSNSFTIHRSSKNLFFKTLNIAQCCVQGALFS